ncbi:MAG: acyl-CoA dehydrogenase [Pseudomonadota bacterium]
MPDILRREDLDFILHDLLDAGRLAGTDRYAGQDPSDWAAALDLAEQLAEDVFQPIAAELDAHEPEFHDGSVRLPESLPAALAVYRDSGLPAAGFPEAIGGMNLPCVISQSIYAVLAAANGPAMDYNMLTVAAANLLEAHGSDALRARYLAPLVEGRAFGTMCLSEPQAGSSLADITTKAEPQPDGTYRLTGTKMWISGGEHDMSENIVHFVLAKIPGGPPGVKGISLFCVPRILPDGSRNDIRLMGLNHKMGNRGTVNTVLALGDQGGATGWLVGPEHGGLACMFVMMNEMRIGVGLGAATTAVTGYLHALSYAKDRPQGRPLTGRDPARPPIAIVEHADVRRNLLQAKAYAEGGLALCLWAATLVDDERAGAEAERARAAQLLDLLTPIVKSWPSEFGIRANDLAIQVHGGYGYTRDYPVERLWRDNRLNPIHEGTKGIQGLDLLGRKVTARHGGAFAALMDEIEADAAEARADAALAGLAEPLTAAAARARATTEGLVSQAPQIGAEAFTANATVYLDMLGHVVVGWLWLRMAGAAARAQASGDPRADLLEGKLAAARFFMGQELPFVHAQCDILERVDRSALEVSAAAL